MRPCKPWTHPEPGGCSESSWCRIKRLCPLSVCLYLVLLLLILPSSFRAGEARAALKGSGTDPKGNEQVRAVLPPGTTWHWGQKRSCFVTSLQEQNSRSKTALQKSNLISFDLMECKKTVSSGGSELLPLPPPTATALLPHCRVSLVSRGWCCYCFPGCCRYRADPASFQA